MDTEQQVILENWNLESVVKALEMNMSSKFAFLPRLENHSHVNEGKILHINSGRKSDMFNIICRAQTSESKDLKAALEIFSDLGLPFAWWQGFQNEPADLSDCLTQLGLTRTESELGMAILLAKLPKREPNPRLDIKPVDNKAKLEHFVEVIMKLVPNDALEIRDFYFRNFESILKHSHKLQLFVGYIENDPVSTSALFCDSGVAGIWDIITLPEIRGRGVGTDMTLAALREGEKRGLKIGVLTASDDGQPVYEKLGFSAIRQYYVYNFTG